VAVANTEISIRTLQRPILRHLDACASRGCQASKAAEPFVEKMWLALIDMVIWLLKLVCTARPSGLPSLVLKGLAVRGREQHCLLQTRFQLRSLCVAASFHSTCGQEAAQPFRIRATRRSLTKRGARSTVHHILPCPGPSPELLILDQPRLSL
jgi:hypothetical protein